MSGDTIEFSKEIRKATLKMVYEAKASHIGGAFSMADILAVLYSGILIVNPSNPKDLDRDRLFLSKGHACTSLYATLALKGFFKLNQLDDYSKDDSLLLSHASHSVPGVEFSTGSLGHALPVACGVALSAKLNSKPFKVYTILSDGELNEGSNWEAILFAQQHKLSNLIIIIDYNKIQSFGFISDIIELQPLDKKFESFGWNVIEIDGHNHEQIYNTCQKVKLQQEQNSNLMEKPTVIIANTLKGKGVDFMEDQLLWHYKSPSKEQYENALMQLNK
jgi:transketolase